MAHNRATFPEDLTPSAVLDSELESVQLTDVEPEYREVCDDDAHMYIPDLMLSPTSLPSPLSSPNLSPLSSEVEPFNPFQLASKKSLKMRSENLLQKLRFHAVAVCVEVFGVARSDLFSRPACFVALFGPGVSPGDWTLLDRTEHAGSTNHVRFLKKFRVLAGTEMDRNEKMTVAIFDKDVRLENVVVKKSMGHEEFSVGEILESKHQMVEKDFKASRKGSKARGTIQLALEMVYHVKEDRQITFDFGFLDNAPVRNRMFFVLSRAVGRGKWSPVYKSEVRLRNDVGRFESVSFGTQEFHGGDAERLFRLEVYRAYKNGKTKLLGFMQSSCEKLAKLEPDANLYWWPAREGILLAKILVQNVEIERNESWFTLRLAPCKA